MMENKYDQSKVAYETGPKEVNTSPSMPAGEKSFGNGNKMPQDDKPKMAKHHKAHHGRHAEHR